MNVDLPSIEQYEKVLPAARLIYEHINSLSWQMLLPMFLLSVTMSYSSDLGLTGSILTRLKRLVLVALLLVAFPMIAEFCQILGVEIAKSIDDISGIDLVLQAASERSSDWTNNAQGLLNLGSDLIMGALVFCCFIILVLARYFLLAFQHFYWFTMIALGPLLILCSLFESTTGITRNLFKNMVQVACWPIMWSLLSAFLKCLPFATTYQAGSFVTIITLNLLVAVALLFSPFMVSQLCDGVSLSVGDPLRRGALRAVEMSAPKVKAITTLTQTKYKNWASSARALSNARKGV